MASTTINFILFFSILILPLVYSFPFGTTSSTTPVPISDVNLTATATHTTTERPPNNVSKIEMTPDVNHALTIDHQNTVINLGQSLSMGITNAIVRPLTFFNNLIGSAAGSLPGLFAANGAALGTAIATPIQLGTLAANAAISGITGTLVSIPISLASGGAAQFVGLVGTGRQLWASTLGSDPANSTFWQNGEVWLQPLALVTGANSVMTGISLQALSSGVKSLGLGIERFGVTLTQHGEHVQNLGSIMVGWANGEPLMAPVVNDTETNQVNVDLSDLLTSEAQKIEVVASIDVSKIKFPTEESNKLPTNNDQTTSSDESKQNDKVMDATTTTTASTMTSKLIETTTVASTTTSTTSTTTMKPILKNQKSNSFGFEV